MITPGALQGLRVLHFGHFDPDYSRNRIVGKALRRAGADVRVVTDQRPFARRTPVLVREAMHEPVDLVLVGFPGHADVATAKAIATVRGAPVLFDAFVSLQETAEDRNGSQGPAPRRRRLELEDRVAFRLADRVLVDTDAHGEHFVNDLGVQRSKLRRLWVGADDDVMQPRSAQPHEGFRLFVYASFIPLHGLEHVVRAAALLETRGIEVTIDVVGDGDTATAVHRLAADLGVHSVHFLGRRPYVELPELIAHADACLGIFGTSPKAQRVIPNKVYDALACARPVITADTPAIAELLRADAEVMVCPPGDPERLADAIARIRGDGALRSSIAARGHARFRETAGIDALSQGLVAIVDELR